MKRWASFLFLLLMPLQLHAAILSLGGFTDASGSRIKSSWYEEWGNEQLNLGLQLDYFSYSNSRAYSQIAIRHINLEGENYFYRAVPIEKLKMGLGLNLDNYYSQPQILFTQSDLGHMAGFGNENFNVFVLGQNQGLGAVEVQANFESPGKSVKSTFSASIVQQDAYLAKFFFHAQSVGAELQFSDFVKFGYESAEQLAGQSGSLLRVEAGKLDTASAYYEIDQYQNGFIPKYVGRLYQNYYLSNQNLSNRNLSGQFSETGLKLAWGSDNRVQVFQRQDLSQAWGGNLLWALGENVFFEYEYEKPLPLYNATFFQRVEFQRFKALIERQKDAQFVFQYQKFTDIAGTPVEDLLLEYLLKI